MRWRRRPAELQPEGHFRSPLWLIGLHLQPLGPRVPRDRDGDSGGMWRWVRQQLVGASIPCPAGAASQAWVAGEGRRRGAARLGRGRLARPRQRRARGPEPGSPAQPRCATRLQAPAARAAEGGCFLPALLGSSLILADLRRLRPEAGVRSGAGVPRGNGEGTASE